MSSDSSRESSPIISRQISPLSDDETAPSASSSTYRPTYTQPAQQTASILRPPVGFSWNAPATSAPPTSPAAISTSPPPGLPPEQNAQTLNMQTSPKNSRSKEKEKSKSKSRYVKNSHTPAERRNTFRIRNYSNTPAPEGVPPAQESSFWTSIPPAPGRNPSGSGQGSSSDRYRSRKTPSSRGASANTGTAAQHTAHSASQPGVRVLRTLTLLMEDRRGIQPENMLAEVRVPLKQAEDPADGFWADAKEVCEALQSSPSRIEGRAKVSTMRGKYRQFFLTVAPDGKFECPSANLKVTVDRTIEIFVEDNYVPGAAPQTVYAQPVPRYNREILPQIQNPPPIATLPPAATPPATASYPMAPSYSPERLHSAGQEHDRESEPRASRKRQHAISLMSSSDHYGPRLQSASPSPGPSSFQTFTRESSISDNGQYSRPSPPSQPPFAPQPFATTQQSSPASSNTSAPQQPISSHTAPRAVQQISTQSTLAPYQPTTAQNASTPQQPPPSHNTSAPQRPPPQSQHSSVTQLSPTSFHKFKLMRALHPSSQVPLTENAPSFHSDVMQQHPSSSQTGAPQRTSMFSHTAPTQPAPSANKSLMSQNAPPTSTSVPHVEQQPPSFSPAPFTPETSPDFAVSPEGASSPEFQGSTDDSPEYGTSMEASPEPSSQRVRSVAPPQGTNTALLSQASSASQNSQLDPLGPPPPKRPRYDPDSFLQGMAREPTTYPWSNSRNSPFPEAPAIWPPARTPGNTSLPSMFNAFNASTLQGGTSNTLPSMTLGPQVFQTGSVPALSASSSQPERSGPEVDSAISTYLKGIICKEPGWAKFVQGRSSVLTISQQLEQYRYVQSKFDQYKRSQTPSDLAGAPSVTITRAHVLKAFNLTASWGDECTEVLALTALYGPGGVHEEARVVAMLDQKPPISTGMQVKKYLALLREVNAKWTIVDRV